MDIRLTEEQVAIIKTLGEQEKSVRVNAVAGSGKTTLSLGLAAMFPNKKILSLTYNRKLKDEASEKVKLNNLTNIEIKTFHGYASKVAGRVIHDDYLLERFLNENKNIPYISQYDIVIVDEAQDLNNNFFRLISKYLKNTGVWLVIGDLKQSINQFMGADSRYMRLFDKLMGIELIDMRLTYTFRNTYNMVNFINNHLFNYEYMKAFKQKDDPENKDSVIYLNLLNPFSPSTGIYRVYEKIEEVMFEKNIKDGEVFIIHTTTKPSDSGIKKPMQMLENLLVEHNHLVHISNDNDIALNDNDIEGKISFTTFNQTKGRERKLVVILNFDNGYFKWFNKDANPEMCTNALYVGATRATQVLILVEEGQARDEYQSNFNFINKWDLISDSMVSYINYDYKGKKNNKPKFIRDEKQLIEIKTSPTHISKYITQATSNHISKLIDSITTKNNNDIFYLKLSNNLDKDTNGSLENVSQYNAQYLTYKYIETFKGYDFIKQLTQLDNVDLVKHQNILNHGNYKVDTDLHKLLQAIVFKNAIEDSLLNQIRQVTVYNWLDDFNELDVAINRISKVINIEEGGNIIVEQLLTINSKINPNDKQDVKVKNTFNEWLLENVINHYNINQDSYILNDFLIKGRIDFINNGLFVELKATDELSLEHKIQVVSYLFMLNIIGEYQAHKFSNYTSVSHIIKPPTEMILFNVKTNEKLIIKNDEQVINEIMRELIYNKFFFNKTNNEEDNDFIERIKSNL